MSPRTLPRTPGLSPETGKQAPTPPSPRLGPSSLRHLPHQFPPPHDPRDSRQGGWVGFRELKAAPPWRVHRGSHTANYSQFSHLVSEVCHIWTFKTSLRIIYVTGLIPETHVHISTRHRAGASLPRATRVLRSTTQTGPGESKPRMAPNLSALLPSVRQAGSISFLCTMDNALTVTSVV